MSEKDIRVHIEEIRKQLWLGHASLMVGSGFSRNADKATPTTPTPPDWAGLADRLIEKLYPAADENERANIRADKSVLRLADEFEIAFKRSALNALLKDCIQDDNLLPSALHVKLLELPWADVFTTNYDTLLERTAQQVISIKYDVVLNSNNLPYSEAPRIIKLHGSFPPGTTHLIVSEEDYRTYPTKHSPFVNTVQQAIMESVLCLIGFSGTDPNFLEWIGWVRDNLQKSMLPIYLIGIFDMSAAEREWLLSKNIKTIDLSELPDVPQGDYAKALHKFLDGLSEQPDYYNWPKNEAGASLELFRLKNDSPEEFMKVIQYWAKERETYPNWLTLPWNKRLEMVTFTEQWTPSTALLKDLPAPWDIEGLYELNWRLEKCLMPIFNDAIPVYEGIIGKYDPFGLNGSQNINRELQEKWLDLCFAVLRWSREELDEEKWDKYEGIIQKSIANDIYSRNRLFHEQAFHALALPNVALFDEIMSKWSAIEHPLLWKVKMASVLYIAGAKDSANSLWTDALNELRPHVPKGKIKNDFYLLSLEGSILVNLCRTTFGQTQNQTEKDQREKYRKRLQELAAWGCNPWENLDNFSLALEHQVKRGCEDRTIRDFNSKTSNLTFRSGWDPQYTLAFQHLRFFEEAGIPFVDGNSNKTLKHAASYIAEFSPAWAFCILNIIGSSIDFSCELVFGQEKLYLIAADRMNCLVDSYVRQLQYITTAQSECLTQSSNNFYTQTAKNLVEVLSRLTVKASPENLKRLLILGAELYKFGDKVLFFQKLGSRYFKRVFDAMLPQQILDNLDVLLSIQIPTKTKIFWESPALFVDWRGFKSSPKMCTSSLKEKLEYLISELDTDDANYRSNVLSYLNICLEVNLLSTSHKTRIAKNLQKHSTPGSLPATNNFYQFAYIRFLAPLNNRQGIEAALKEYYFKESTSLFEGDNGKIVIQLLQDTDFIRMAHSLLATCSVFNQSEWSFFDLSVDECKKLFENLFSAWESAKNKILDILSADNQWSEHAQVVKRTLVYLDKILGEVVIPRVLKSDLFERVLAFVRELEKHFQFPISNISSCCKQKKYGNDIFIEFLAALNECDVAKFKSYSYAVFNAYRFAERGELPPPPLPWLDVLISVVHMKSDNTFCKACGILGSIFDFCLPPPMQCDILLAALKNLLETTSFEGDSNRFSMRDRYDYRQAATYLAAELYCMFSKRKKEIPAVLKEWYDLSKSPEELPDIRNTWMRL